MLTLLLCKVNCEEHVLYKLIVSGICLVKAAQTVALYLLYCHVCLNTLIYNKSQLKKGTKKETDTTS